MKRVIRFSRARYWFFGFSSLLILIGIAGYIVNHGLNLGVDFRAGIAFQFQVAPASFTVQYTGPDKAEISIPAGEEALTAPGDIIFTITSAQNGSKQTFPFKYAGFATVRDLADAIQKQVAGVSVQVMGDASASPSELEPLSRPADITNTPFTINRTPGPGRGVETNIAEMRSVLAAMGDFSLQAVGPASNQEFISRIPVLPGTDERAFLQDTETSLMRVLEGKYGSGQVILKSTDFVGARMAQGLATQTIWLVLIAILGIFIYMFFRFRPWIYGAAGVLGILHDALIMLAFDAVFRIEIDAATIAAILTILGYSINDTIVNFDRARENTGLMRGESLRTILDTSVTQTLSRTFITSGATLLTVIALFVLTSGSIKNFALNMIVGIVEGTYSTFISAFFVIEWVNWRDRRRKSDNLAKYGILAEAPVAPATQVVSQEAEGEPEGEEIPGGLLPVGQLAPQAAMAGSASMPAAPSAVGPSAVGQSAVGESAAPAGAPAPRPSAPVNVAFPGQTGSRKHKKHRRRHH
jgi:preprotein translocase subunit SecF